MGKRLISLLLAVVMVIGMVPISALPTFAAETEKPNIFASYAENVAVDGALSESAWLTYGKMTSADSTTVKNFGVLWDKGNLYLGFNSTDEVTVQINGAAVPVKSVTGTAAKEIAVSLADVAISASNRCRWVKRPP